MKLIFRLCLPVALGAMALGQISIANATDNRLKGRGGGQPAAVPHAAAPARVAAPQVAAPRVTAPHFAAPSRTAVTPRIPTRNFAAPAHIAARPNFPAGRNATVNRSLARVGTNTRTLQSRGVAGLPQNRATFKGNALRGNNALTGNTLRGNALRGNNALTGNTLRSNSLRGSTLNRYGGVNGLNRGNLASRGFTRQNTGALNQSAIGSRRLGRLNTAGASRFNTARAGALAPNATRGGLVNGGDPRRSFASDQFAFRSGNFQPGWDPGSTYYWQGSRWRCYDGIWAVVNIGWPYDWYAYPYPFYYDGLVYYDGDVYQPGGMPVSSSMVADVQNALANDGYNVGGVDGIDGPQTQNAIAQYQSDSGMQPTGAIDGPLLQSLGLQ